MKDCAVIESGMVVNIVRCEDDWPESPSLVRYLPENPAYIGGDYVAGFFYPPQPYPSWERSEGTWAPPVPYPSDGKEYEWIEDTLSWVSAN
jgi:hypothetical protein